MSPIQFSETLINKAVARKGDCKVSTGRVEGGRLLVIRWESTAMEYGSCLRETEADSVFVIGSMNSGGHVCYSTSVQGGRGCSGDAFRLCHQAFICVSPRCQGTWRVR